MNSLRGNIYKQAQVLRQVVAPISSCGAVAAQQAVLRRKEEVNYWLGPTVWGEGSNEEAPAVADRIAYKPVTSDQVPAVMDVVLGPYLYLAPLQRAVGLRRSDAESVFEEKIANSLSNGDSLIAIDSATNGVVGVMLNETLLKGRRRYTDRYPDSVNRINRLLAHVEGDAFVELPDAKSILKLHDVIVKQEYQNIGIGRRLVELSITKAVRDNCDYVTGTATSPLVELILEEKENFKPIRFCFTKDYMDRLEQEHCFRNIAHSSPRVTFMAKKLSAGGLQHSDPVPAPSFG
jgi:GNAT superfamily N-acetyltransferase